MPPGSTLWTSPTCKRSQSSFILKTIQINGAHCPGNTCLVLEFCPVREVTGQVQITGLGIEAGGLGDILVGFPEGGEQLQSSSRVCRCLGDGPESQNRSSRSEFLTSNEPRFTRRVVLL